ncbi:hypothetical protein MJO28_007033 [Puccinia striiformis f. sp. tritici]|uniref:Uncharacterized protein n=1 Tax=Puccinia striiformis f. sp. tritici TaxID=168172 RepID=A0ACC0ECW5_9BASI|nr:hypothetical protein Pst134EA_013133 [Puccinia striiformis f. sp. tritici]KAI9622690.1 hypothetical protein H4Q26_014971 [Puccinia striiformis f. sp. tritici PST-130]KAH9465241.1 hypothetical protein Pst134EA_013133 [Puccinia striiformis f. sp. tritici]KAI7951349.1 hypothetical protein MJO28_007033 [Puccinia striiformis f. sp. tritici]KAI7955592.1 hypothetical protein MJO29_006991 [Puccinia striiformis f. sp. tritici]KAI9630710.1 hypothetical protein KEM48_013679 [Puccinia striiformis f. sp
MANQSVTPSTVAERTPAATGLPINTNTGINSTHQTNISTSSTPLRTQTSALPTATTSVQSSPVSQWIPPATSASRQSSPHDVDPFSKLGPQAIGAIVFVGALLTVLSLALSFLLWRRKGHTPSPSTSDSDSQSPCQSHATFGHRKRDTVKSCSLGSAHHTSTSSFDITSPPSREGCRMTYIDQTVTSPPWTIFPARGSSSILNWKPHDGQRTPLRLSSDTCMVLDPWLMPTHRPLPSHPKYP